MDKNMVAVDGTTFNSDDWTAINETNKDISNMTCISVKIAL